MAPAEAATDPFSSIETSTSTSSNSAYLEQAGPASGKRLGLTSPLQVSRNIEMLEDDPIGDFDGESLDLPCGQAQQQIEQAGESISTEEEQSQEHQIKKAPYVPNFFKGKGKATTSGTSPFHRASSAKVGPLLLLVFRAR